MGQSNKCFVLYIDSGVNGGDEVKAGAVGVGRRGGSYTSRQWGRLGCAACSICVSIVSAMTPLSCTDS